MTYFMFKKKIQLKKIVVCKEMDFKIVDPLKIVVCKCFKNHSMFFSMSVFSRHHHVNIFGHVYKHHLKVVFI